MHFLVCNQFGEESKGGRDVNPALIKMTNMTQGKIEETGEFWDWNRENEKNSGNEPEQTTFFTNNRLSNSGFTAGQNPAPKVDEKGAVGTE